MNIPLLRPKQGFTLIELSIVLVIIGLIIGGILVGQDMINAAGVRATVAQLEKYNTAVNTFRNKYNALPGDMSAANASQFNFPPYVVGCTFRCGTQGRGDGNGVLDSFTTSLVTNPSVLLGGETAMFWGDLTTANLIDTNLAVDEQRDAVVADTSTINSILPPAKLGGGGQLLHSL